MSQKRSRQAACEAKIRPGGREEQMASGRWAEPGGCGATALWTAFHGRCLFVGGDDHVTRWPAHFLGLHPPGKLGEW